MRFRLPRTGGISGLFPATGLRRDGVVVIMGATGTGKSKLSIEIAERFPAEIVNCDKIQIYRGLDITTNKIPISDRRGIPHHLLGDIDPATGELPPAGFRSLASDAVAKITSRGKLPVIAGGSNSYIYALMVNDYDPNFDPFSRSLGNRHCLRYRSCLLWVDVEEMVLHKHLDKRVDEMIGLGMVKELESYFAKGEWNRHIGLGKAIGVKEIAEYFKRKMVYKEAIDAIKENTRRLAEEQVRKIKILGEMGWDLQRVDATETVADRISGDRRSAWDRDVLFPALRKVENFLEDDSTHE